MTSPTAWWRDLNGGAPLFTLEGVDNPVNAIEWSTDGTRIAAGLHDGSVRIYDGATGDLETIGTGHLAVVSALAWNSDSSQLASGSGDGTVRVWDVGDVTLTSANRLVATELAGGVAGLAFSPDGSRVLASDWGITAAKIFDLGAGAELLGFQASPWPDSMSFTPTGDGLYVRVGGHALGAVGHRLEGVE